MIRRNTIASLKPPHYTQERHIQMTTTLKVKPQKKDYSHYTKKVTFKWQQFSCQRQPNSLPILHYPKSITYQYHWQTWTKPASQAIGIVCWSGHFCLLTSSQTTYPFVLGSTWDHPRRTPHSIPDFWWHYLKKMATFYHKHRPTRAESLLPIAALS